MSWYSRTNSDPAFIRDVARSGGFKREG